MSNAYFRFSILLLFIGFGCNPISNQNEEAVLNEEFKDYWYSGKAELSHYDLVQSRYGEARHGDAVLIFVTEDFLIGPQVKKESQSTDEAFTSVLKLNATRKFITGIYPYSIMTSTFTPVNWNQPTLKVSTSTQEWCGHTYSQLNYKAGEYIGHLHSYFENEGDDEFLVEKNFLEDRIWTHIRQDPHSLPIGEIMILPGTSYLRLSHLPFRLEKATALLDSGKSEMAIPVMKYSLTYQDIPRTLEIEFERDFPYGIVSWTETDKSGEESKITRAKRTDVYRSPYWEQNAVADTVFRKELGLPTY